MTTAPTFVSLLDVIGYRSKIAADRQTGEEVFKDKLQASLAVFNQFNEAEFSYQAISDTLIIATPPTAPFFDLLVALKKIHKSFLSNGLFLRGGVAFAPHFRAGNLTYSHALPVAYQLEQQQAVYPRIVIDENIIEMFKGDGKLSGELANVVDSRLICEQNGVYFVNVADGAEAEYFDLAKSIYDDEAEQLRGREHELAKHRWLQEYILALPAADFAPYMQPMKVFASEDATDGS